MNDRTYRYEESQKEIEILESTVSERPADTVANGEMLQDFTVKYKRPFKAEELSDVNLIPNEEYNITSAWGCYLKTDADTEGTNPEALFSDGFGCIGRWQAVEASIAYTEVNDKGLEISRTAEVQEFQGLTPSGLSRYGDYIAK